MSYHQAAPARRARRLRVASLLALSAAVAVALGDRLPQSASSTAATPIDVLRGERGADRGARGGAVPDATTAFEDELPAVANLDPALRGALRRAAVDASEHGVRLLVESGWRSAEYQARLRDEAVAKYGSPEAAARWVAAPDKSAHVSGDAVDVGPRAAAAWLAAHGAAHGLCQVYANEPWHFELRPAAARDGCPPTYPDPAHDPRLQG